MNLDTDPRRMRQQFACQPGAREIVSEFALLAMWNLYREAHPEHVLEIGHGIGTITGMLAMWRPPNATVHAIEDNPWCLEQAQNHLGYLKGTVIWHDKLPRHESFDLVIVDGPQVAMGDLAPALLSRARVIFEGNRRDQRALFERVLRHVGRSFIRVNLKPADRSKGLWIYQLEPTHREIWRYRGQGWLEWGRDLGAKLNGRTVGKRRYGW